MAQKNNIRSIRFSDELAGLIESQPGETFTQKFENLVTKCYGELPQKEEELQRVQEKINQEWQRLADLRQATAMLYTLERNIKDAQRYFEIVERQAKRIADKMTEEEA